MNKSLNKKINASREKKIHNKGEVTVNIKLNSHNTYAKIQHDMRAYRQAFRRYEDTYSLR